MSILAAIISATLAAADHCHVVSEALESTQYVECCMVSEELESTRYVECNVVSEELESTQALQHNRIEPAGGIMDVLLIATHGEDIM